MPNRTMPFKNSKGQYFFDFMNKFDIYHASGGMSIFFLEFKFDHSYLEERYGIPGQLTFGWE